MCTWGVEGDVCIAMCVRRGVLRGMCEYLRLCAGGVEGDVYIPTGVCTGGVEGDVYIAMCVRWGC